MQWEATDQFGNLFVAMSEATSLDELKPQLTSLVEELQSRNPSGFQVTFDFGYGEINGPDPDQVSHVIQIPWIQEVGQDAGFLQAVTSYLIEVGPSNLRLERA